MGRAPRISIALILAFLAGVLAVLAQPNMPAAHAGESGRPAQGNYVALAKPARIFGQTITGQNLYNFTGLGVQGIPLQGTTGLQVMVSLQNYNDIPYIFLLGKNIDRYPPLIPFKGRAFDGSNDKGPVMSSYVVAVDDTVTTNQLGLWDSRGTSTSSVYVAVDVVGYYTKNAVGGGYVPVNQTTLFDTKANNGPAIPAGGTITKKLTGGIIPTGASAVFMDLFVYGTTGRGTIIAVPYGTDTSAYPVLRLWTNAYGESDLVSVKLNPDGQVTFKNTSAASVHLVARAEGYVTDSPATGADWQPGNSVGFSTFIGGGQKVDYQVTGSGYPIVIPSTGIAAAMVKITTRDTSVANYLKIYPSGTASNPNAILNPSSSLDDGTISRTSGAIIAPGAGGKVTIENVSTEEVSVSMQVDGWYASPTNYASEGGTSGISRAMTSGGPCYALIDRTAYNSMTAGCSEDDSVGAVYAQIAPSGEAFNSAVSVASRPGGHVVMSAWHAPDGEIWTWEFAHTSGGTTAKPVRTFRYMKAPLTIGTMPDGSPVGFTYDAQGRFWAVDLNVAAPQQPIWIPLDIPTASLAPVGRLTALATVAGIQLFGTTAGGDVVTGWYFGKGTPGLGWVSLGATNATGQVAVNFAQSGDIAVVVRHLDNSLWSRTGANGWTRVNTTWNGETIVPTGAPTAVYDPSTQKIGAMFWSNEGVARGRLFLVWETSPNTADFSGPVTGISLFTSGIGSDVIAWDYRNENPLTRYWASMYIDADGGKQFRPLPPI